MTTRIPVQAMDPAGGSAGYVPVIDAGGTVVGWGPAGALPLGGTDGQVLTKQSATDGDAAWETPAGGGGGSTLRDINNPADSGWGTASAYDVEFDTDGSTLPTGWSWLNQGTATWAQAFGAGVLRHPGAASDDVKALVRALPSEASWTATVRARVGGLDGTGFTVGLLVRDSATGRLLVTGPRHTRTYAGFYFNSATSFASNVFTTSAALLDTYQYVRVRKNSATSWDFEGSIDGSAWHSFAAGVNVSTFIATPNQIGVAVYRTGSVPTWGSFHWFRVR